MTQKNKTIIRNYFILGIILGLLAGIVIGVIVEQIIIVKGIEEAGKSLEGGFLG